LRKEIGKLVPLGAKRKGIRFGLSQYGRDPVIETHATPAAGMEWNRVNPLAGQRKGGNSPGPILGRKTKKGAAAAAPSL
jgi:hypothetical protein